MGITDWKIACFAGWVASFSFSMLRTIHPGNGRVVGGEPWIDVTPPTIAFTSAYRSAAAAAAMPMASDGRPTSRP